MLTLTKNYLIWINIVCLMVVIVGLYISKHIKNVTNQADSVKEYEYCHNTSYNIASGLIYFCLVWILFISFKDRFIVVT